MRRSRLFVRIQRDKAIRRKLKIIHHGYTQFDMTDRQVGKLAKGKVHCSCPLCAIKSKEILRRSDKAKIEGCNQQLDEL